MALRVGLLMDQVMSTEMLRRLKLLIESYEERVESGAIGHWPLIKGHPGGGSR